MQPTDRIIHIWLASSGASTKKLNAMLEIYSPTEIWDSIAYEHYEKVLGASVHAKLKSDKKDISRLIDRVERLQKKGISVVTRADDQYPERLNQSEVNPPVMLYAKGDVSLLKTTAVAIVGTRASSRYGKETAERFSTELAVGGLTIVSGLATGIDAYAHQAAVECGGKTIAVLGGGFEHVYPAVNIPLYHKIIERGGLAVTEYAPDVEPARYTFPERNRIISGLSTSVIIIEAGKGSGTLITAECALEQGRDVYAVPGNISSARSEGTNELILGGATILLRASQVFDSLKLTVPEMKKSVLVLDIFEQKVYDLLEHDPKPFDEILVNLGQSPSELTALLTSMELKGIIKRLPSNFFKRE